MNRRSGLARRAACGAMAVAVAASGSGGCGTAVRSVRLDPDKPLPAKTEVGVIYQMTRPRVVIVPTPGTADAPAKFTVGVGTEPDPGHRYALSVEPGPFNAVTELSVTLNSDGSIKELTEESKEQVTPVIKAVGEFAVSVLGALTTGMAAGVLLSTDAEKAVAQQKANELVARLRELKNTQPALRTAGVTDAGIDAVITSITTEQTKAGFDDDALADALRGPVVTGDPAAVAALAAVVKPGGPGEPPLVRKRRDDAEATFNAAAPPAPVPPGRRTLPPALAAKLESADAKPEVRDLVADEWDRAVDETRAAVADRDLLALLRLQKRELVSDAVGVPVELKNLSNDAATNGASAALAGLDLTGLSQLPTPAQRQYAEVKRLLKDAAGLDEKWRSTPAGPARDAVDVQRTDVRRQAYEWAGGEREFAEFVKLQRVVAAGPPAAAAAGHASPVQEYAAARAQLADVQLALADRLSKLKAAADPEPAKPAVWEPKAEIVPFLWSVQREAVEGTAPPRRLLRVTRPDGDPVADRVFLTYGNNVNAWPKFVVKIDKGVRR